MYIRSHSRTAAIRVGGTIWGALAGSAAALLLGQILLQIIYAAGNAGWATDPHTRRVLQLFGLTKANGFKHIILVRKFSEVHKVSCMTGNAVYTWLNITLAKRKHLCIDDWHAVLMLPEILPKTKYDVWVYA